MRATRLDGSPRDPWALWMARLESAKGNREQAAFWEARADELTDAERRAAQAAKDREFARVWRAAGGDEALAARYDEAVARLEQPTPFAWPLGATRTLAERLAAILFVGAPVEAAPDAFLAGMWSAASATRPELIAQVMATPANAPLPAPAAEQPRADSRDASPTLVEQMAVTAPVPVQRATDRTGTARYTTRDDRTSRKASVSTGQTRADRKHVAEARAMESARKAKAWSR